MNKIENKTAQTKQKNKKSKKKLGFIAFLFMISDSIAKFLRRGVFGFLFADLYAKIDQKWQNGFICNFSKKVKRKIHSKSKLISFYEKSKTNSKVSWLSNNIIHSSLKIWGTRFFFFGFALIIVSTLKVFLEIENFDIRNLWNHVKNSAELGNIILSIVLMLASVPLVLSNREFGEEMLRHRLTRFIITDVLNLNANRFVASESSKEGNYIFAILLSLMLGFLTFFMTPFVMLNSMLLLATILLILSFPEIGVLLLIVTVPFVYAMPHPNIFMISLAVFTICGFVSKFIRGKRVLKFEFIDILMLLMGALLMFGGIFGAGKADSFKTSESLLALFVMYFMIVNLYIRKPSIYRGIKTVMFAGVIVSVISIVYVMFHQQIFSFKWVESVPVQNVLSGIKHMLVDREAVGIYLLMIYPLALGQLFVTRKKINQLFYLICVATIVTSIIVSTSNLVRVGLVVATFIFLIIYNLKFLWLMLASVVTFVGAILLLPSNITLEVRNFFGVIGEQIVENYNIACNLLSVIFENFFTGIGVGEEAFLAAYYHNNTVGSVLVTDSHNLFLQILLELGIVGLVIFALVLLAFAQKSFSNIKAKHGKSRSRTMICAGYSSITIACILGFQEYIWINYRSFLVFWFIFALTVALTKANEQEFRSERIINNMTSVDIEID